MYYYIGLHGVFLMDLSMVNNQQEHGMIIRGLWSVMFYRRT